LRPSALAVLRLTIRSYLVGTRRQYSDGTFVTHDPQPTSRPSPHCAAESRCGWALRPDYRGRIVTVCDGMTGDRQWASRCRGSSSTRST
jgi:hypothetical protein